MTTNLLGYNIPSSFKMIQVHQDEFNRINKLKNLSKCYKDYLQMIYVKYICNKKEIKPTIVVQQPRHCGLKMLHDLKQ
jgi:NADH:ubiquinone oxidoreductase subunit D